MSSAGNNRSCEQKRLKKMKNKKLMVAAIVLIACCLRAPITGVGPLTTTIQDALELNSTVAGLLTTLPLITIALVSFVTGPLSRKFGIGNVMLFSLGLMIIGLLARSYLGTPGLFIGSFIIGAGVGINNVALPPVIKTEFPDRIGQLTGVYTTVMAAFASLSTGISVPVSTQIGWQNALVIWCVLIVLAIILWVPNRKVVLPESRIAAKKKSVARSPITWYMTLFMGFQSVLFYCFVAWFSTILQSKGYSASVSGVLNMVTLLCGLPGSFIMPIIASRTKHQSFWGAFIGLCYTAGMVSTMFAEHAVPLVITILCFGFGSGAAIAFCMVMFNLHTHDADDAASVSGFAQGIGYIMAALGPVLIGRIIDSTGSWNVALIVLACIGVVCTVFGWMSGLDRMVETEVK